MCAVSAVCGGAYVTINGASYGSPSAVHNSAPANAGSKMIRPVSIADNESSPLAYAKTFSSDYKLSGPYSSKNLQIYLLSGANKAEKWPFLAVHDAIEQKKAKIAETGDVNQLSITNKSDQVVFIHSGDILKGGNQDRMSQYDAMIPPRQTLALAAFCVEQDRWTKRGEESSENFAVPKPSSLPSYFPAKMKRSPALQGATNGCIGPMISAARLAGDQSAVWNTVSKAQSDLGYSTGANVKDSRSDSSFELTLEGPAMQKARLPYIDPLSDLPEKSETSIGYLAFVDGKYVAGDSYISHDLFMKMWPKMLCVRATDAIVATKQPMKVSGTNPATLLSAKAQRTEVNSRTTQVARSIGRLALFDTLDTKLQKSVHVSIARK